MRLSDAIALGRVLVRPRGGREWHPDGSGCARGMALEGCGMGRITAQSSASINWNRFHIVWPWVSEVVPAYPCGCAVQWTTTIFNAISHIFDEHVEGAGDWTLDQLIDCVRSVEPKEIEAAEEKTIAGSAPALVAQG